MFSRISKVYFFTTNNFAVLSAWRTLWFYVNVYSARFRKATKKKKLFSVAVYLLDYEIKHNMLLIRKALFLRVTVGRVTHRLGQIRPRVARGK